MSETKEYIECGCNHLSEYTVLADSDDRTGFEIYFFVACFFTMVSASDVTTNECQLAIFQLLYEPTSCFEIEFSI